MGAFDFSGNFDGQDGNGPGGGGGSGGGRLHLTVEAHMFSDALRRGEVHVYEGFEEDIKDRFNALKVGDTGGDLRFLDDSDDAWGTPFISNIAAPRRAGKTWTMAVTITQLRKVVQWTIDFAEIDKDIRTWRQNIQSLDDDKEQSEIPDLVKLAQWERAKDIQDWTDYDDFKTVDGDELEDATLELAQMIKRGIDSYTIHTPVPTMSFMYYDGVSGTGKLLDTYLTELPAGPQGWTELGRAEMWEQMNALTYQDAPSWSTDGTISYKWLCVADKAVPNGDGSYMRTIQWMRVDKVEDKLYNSGSSADGGFA
jgi:hypothetical protein